MDKFKGKQENNLYLSCLQDVNHKNIAYLKPSTKSNTAKNIVDYFKKIGVPEENIFHGVEILRKVPINYRYINDTNSWINILELYTIITNCQYYSPLGHTIDNWFAVAANVYDHQDHMAWRILTKLVPLKLMFGKVISLISNYNTYQHLDLLPSGNNNEVIYRLSLNKDINEISPGVATHYTAGVLAQIPRAHGMGQAKIEILFNQSKLANIVNILYNKFNLIYKKYGETIMINGQLIGRYVSINVDANEKQETLKANNSTFGILITKDFFYNNLLLLKKGDIYDSPYSKIKLSWRNEIKQLASVAKHINKFKNVSELIRHYTEQINETKQKYFDAEISRIHAEMAETDANKAKLELAENAHKLQSMVDNKTAELKQKNDFMRLLTSSISHALKTPLSSLSGTLEIFATFKEQITDNDKINFIDNMQNDVKRLEQLVIRLLELSKTDMLSDELEYCLLFPVLQKIKKTYEKKGVSISMDIDTQYVLQISENSLIVLFTNLFDNTLHHGGERPHVNLSIVHQKGKIGENLILDYIDDGPGIPPAIAKQIFDPLFTTSSSKMKTGLGLSIVKKIMENNYGHIDQIPRNEGAHFQLTFSLADNDITI